MNSKDRKNKHTVTAAAIFSRMLYGALLALLCFVMAPEKTADAATTAVTEQVSGTTGQAIVTTSPCGKNATWYFDEASETLHIQGTGAIERSMDWISLNITNIEIASGITSITGSTFTGITTLTTATLPEGLLSIKNYAFSGCTNLHTINIPSTVTSMGNYCFNSCSNLKNIQLPKGLKSLGYSAFSYCSALKNINLPSSIDTIPSICFYRCRKLSKMTIPSHIRTIDNAAFAYSGLTSITIPKSVTRVDYSAFQHCNKLQRVRFYSDVVPSECFYGCTILNDVKFSTSTRRFGSYAFAHTGIENFTIPKNVNSIGYGCFAYCSDLRTLKLSKGMSSLPSYFIMDCKKLKSITIPSSIKTLQRRCFTQSCIRKLTIPASVTRISRYALDFSGQLRTVNFKASVKKIPDHCFSNCYKLRSVTISGKAEKIGEFAFSRCYGLKKFPVCPGVRSLDFKSFMESGLQEVKLSDSITTVDYWAFKGCEKLKTVTIGKNVRTLRRNAFSGCSKLTNFIVSPSNTHFATDNGALFDHARHTLIICPMGKKGTYTLPSSTQKIGVSAFNGCTRLTQIASASSYFSTENGVLYSRDKRTLIACPAGKTGSLTVPSHVRIIGTYAFANSSLKKIKLPASLEKIEYCAFQFCSNLRSITIPGTVKEISNAAFWKCTSLFSVYLKTGTKTIGRNAFYGCSHLHKFKVSPTVTNIHSTAFARTSYRLIFYCKKSSYAMTYAYKHGISYRII